MQGNYVVSHIYQACFPTKRKRQSRNFVLLRSLISLTINPSQTARRLIGAFGCVLAEGFDVFERRQAEQAAVFAVELRGAVVADFERGAGGVHLSADEQAARFLQAKLLLVLERAHRRDGFEFMMQRRDAHAVGARQLVNRKARREILPDPFDHAPDTVCRLVEQGFLKEQMPVFTG
jgi:hypothetical protein